MDSCGAVSPSNDLTVKVRADTVSGAAVTYAIPDDPDFQDWFQGSKAVGQDGRPVLVFRGEHGRQDCRRIQSRCAAISFGDLETAILYASDPNDRSLVAEEPRIMPAYLHIANPLVTDTSDPFIDLKRLEEMFGREEAVRIALKFEASIRDTGFWYENVQPEFRSISVADFLESFPERLPELYFQIFVYLNDAEEVAKLKAAGIDGAIHCGFGDNATDPEYKVFDEGQIAPAAAWLPPDEVRQFAAEWEARRMLAPRM